MSPQQETRVPVSAEERARILRAMAVPVAGAARLVREQERTTLSREDLEALAMLAVWRKLPGFDPARARFDSWAFYEAYHAMLDASRQDRKEAVFVQALRRGAQGRIAHDDQAAASDFHNDTPETDLARLRARTQRIAASAWLQTHIEYEEAGAPVERSLDAAEAVRALHEEVARLSEEQRTHLHLRFWDGTEVAEVAERLGISQRTLLRRWTETRDLLERRLRARGVLGVPEGFGEAVDSIEAAGKTTR